MSKVTNSNARPASPSATASTAKTTSTSPAPVGLADEALDMPTDTGAATYEGVQTPAATPHAAQKSAPFAPPSPPQLRNEDTAASPMERESIRDANEALIKGYNKEYGAYLERYVQAVAAAPNLDRIRAFGPPVDYDPARNVPVPQQRNYDHLIKTKLDSNIDVHEAIGERVLRETGHKLPGAYAFADVKATLFGNGVKARASFDAEGLHGKASTQVGLNSKLIEPDAKAFDHKIGVGVTTNIDAETGEAKTALQVRVGAMGIEADEAGRLTVDGGVDVGPGSVKAGSSYDGKNRRAEAFVKGGIKAGDAIELEGKLGVGVQLLTTDYMKAVVDPNAVGFFDKTKLIGGR